MEQPRTQYARSGELAIAYQAFGSGEHDILLSGGTASYTEGLWDIPDAARLFSRLGRFARVIAYDRRDTGLSDPILADLTLEAHAADALAILDAVGSQSAVLFGALDGARSLALLAATHPDRVAGLVTLSSSARGTAASAPAFSEKVESAITDLDTYPAGVVGLYSTRARTDPEHFERLAGYIRRAATPRQAARLLRMSLASDISAALPLVQAPTLVLFPRDLELVPAEAVREFADLIPGASFREIPGNSAWSYDLDPDLIGDIIEEFVTGAAPAPTSTRVLATVLFTDIVDSTRRAAEAGDRAWAQTLERHLGDARAAVGSAGGELVKTTGDGILALFPGPAQGVRCAQRVSATAQAHGLAIRSGLHTGEVERGGGDVAGLAVHLAARIMALAGASEILVSRTIRDLVIGSELTFSERGEHELKGVPDRWSLYAVA